jgi:short-subunit dehydrogenase
MIDFREHRFRSAEIFMAPAPLGKRCFGARHAAPATSAVDRALKERQSSGDHKMPSHAKPLAIVTGASAGIGYELAKLCAQNGFDLVVAADQPKITEAAEEFRRLGAAVDTVEADLATIEGVDSLYAALQGRPVDALLANAGHGLGGAFLDQDFGEARHVLDTNVTGTIYLIQKVGRDMRARGTGRILITGSEAGFIPGAFHAVYNGTKAFIDSFSFALRNELKDTDVTVTCLMPGPTETEFFERADMMDTKVGQQSKDDPAYVARLGFKAMMRGDGDVVAGWKNKISTSIATVTPAGLLAEQHRKLAEPGYRKSDGSGLAVPAMVGGAAALLGLVWMMSGPKAERRAPAARTQARAARGAPTRTHARAS